MLNVGKIILKVGRKKNMDTNNTEKMSISTPFDLFGVECGEGWFGLIQPVLDYIEKYNSDKEENDKITIDQIKEKWGSLRIYTNFYTEELEKLIEEAELESLKTCELCGSREDIGTKYVGWQMTLCRNCTQKMANDEKRPLIWCKRGDDKSSVIEPE